MGNPSPIPWPIDPNRWYIVSGAVWLAGMGIPAACGLGAHQILYRALLGWELTAEMATFQQCVAGAAFSFNPPDSAVSVDAIIGPFD